MNIIFTGASSFTGYWFVKKLVEDGNNVIALLLRKIKIIILQIKSKGFLIRGKL